MTRPKPTIPCTHTTRPHEFSTPLLDLVLDALEELKAKNIASLDVRAMTSVADDMVIASGTSSRHVKALADNVMEKAKDAGYRPWAPRVNAAPSGSWWIWATSSCT